MNINVKFLTYFNYNFYLYKFLIKHINLINIKYIYIIIYEFYLFKNDGPNFLFKGLTKG